MQSQSLFKMTTKTNIYLFLLFTITGVLFNQTPLYSQSDNNYSEYDSVYNQLSKDERIKYVLGLFQEHSNDKKFILHFAPEIEPLVVEHGTREQIAETFKMLGTAQYTFGKAPEAKKYISDALEIYQSLNDTIWELTMWIYMASIEHMEGEYSRALEYFLKALELDSYYFDSTNMHTRSAKDLNSRGDILNGIGNVNLRYGNYNKSREFYHKALEIVLKLKDTMGIATFYNNLANTYVRQQKYDTAMTFYEKGLEYTGNEAFKKQRASLYNNMGNVYWYQEDYKSALDLIIRNLKINRELGDLANLSFACNNVGGLYIHLNDFDKAEKYLKEGLSLARQTNLGISIQQNLLALSDLALVKNDASEALDYYKKYSAIKDSLLNEKITEQLTEMQTKYDTDRISDELQLQSLKVKNRDRLIYFIIIAILLLLVLIYLLFNRYKLKQKNQKNELEKQNLDIGQRLLRSQVNPHFIFNSLNSIKAFVLKNQGDEAALYLDKFASLMRLNLTNSRESFIPLANDINALELNLELESLRFSGKFDFKIIINKNIDPELIYIPPMLVQPYIENAILHGLATKKEKGNIEVSFKKENKNILCVIEDNGIGRKAAKKIKPEKKKSSLGMKLTTERLELLKREIGLDISVKIIDLRDPSGEACGTRVELLIPFEEE